MLQWCSMVYDETDSLRTCTGEFCVICYWWRPRIDVEAGPFELATRSVRCARRWTFLLCPSEWFIYAGSRRYRADTRGSLLVQLDDVGDMQLATLYFEMCDKTKISWAYIVNLNACEGCCTLIVYLNYGKV